MKPLKILVLILISLNIQLPAQKMQGVDYIINDTIYYSDTVLINNDIIIDSNQLLIIEPGSYLEFQNHYQIKVRGLVKAIGNEYDSIFFTINDTTLFADTSTVKGGWKGINFWDRNDIDTSVFRYCKFEYGKSVSKSNANKNSKGGAIFLSNYSNILISNSTFNCNLAGKEGGGLYSRETPIIISSNTFTNNRTFFSGGGIRIIFEDAQNKILSNDNELIVIDKNLFQYNIAYRSHLGWAGGDGGAISLSTAISLINPRVINNKLFNNMSTTILYESCYYHTIENNIICNNNGIGYYNGQSGSNGNFINNTVSNNYGIPANGGIVINSHSNSFKIKNNIIWGNDGYYYWEDTLQVTFRGHGTGFTIDYNCLNYGHNGEGNIDTSPMFVNPTFGTGMEYNGADADWSLLNNSACINTGTPDTAGLYLPENDIAGNPRIYGIRIDMGAYENQVVVGLPQNPFVPTSIDANPNPFKNQFSIKIPHANKINCIKIQSLSGKTIKKMEQPQLDGWVVINMQDYKPGLYVIIVEYSNGTIIVKKMLKI